MHGIAYDPVHDEVSLPVALSSAVLVFRGGASGEEAPLRVIQGTRTGLVMPQSIDADPAHNEIFVGDPSARAILVFRREASGNVAPIRAVRGGPRSQMNEITGVAVDPVHNLMVVSQRGITPESTGLVIFNRTDDGDVAPRAVIAGPHTHLAHFRQVQIDPERGKIYVAIQSQKYKHPVAYVVDQVRPGLQVKDLEDPERSPFDRDRNGFIGVWDIHDHGDVPPRAVIHGTESRLLGPGGVGLNPKDGEIIAVDGGSNGFYTYFLPQLFDRTFWEGGR